MKVSVVVPAFNEERGLASALNSIRRAMTAFDDLGWSSELIVCANNSTDRTAALAASAGAPLVFGLIPTISYTANVGDTPTPEK